MNKKIIENPSFFYVRSYKNIGRASDYKIAYNVHVERRINVNQITYISKDRFDQLLEFTTGEIGEAKLSSKKKNQFEVLAEESIATLIAHADGHADALGISVYKRFGTKKISISMPGEEFSLTGNLDVGELLDHSDEYSESPESEEARIRAVLFKAAGNSINYNRKNGVNTITLIVQRMKNKTMVYTFIAMILAVIMGFIFATYVPSDITSWVKTNVITTIKTMFMNALKMVVAPVVFLSLVNCIGQFGKPSEIGRVGGKIIGLYLCTSVIAVMVGLFIFHIMTPGNPNLAGAMDQDISSVAASAEGAAPSIKDMIVEIIPSNIVNAFSEMNMLQIIFLAVIIGISLNYIGVKGDVLKTGFDSLNSLFMTITGIVMKFMPIFAFCAIFSFVVSTGVKAMLSALFIYLTLCCGIFIMIFIYSIMVAVLARLNPIVFLKKYASTAMQIFALASSNPAIPLQLNVCENKLGIHKRICSLSIPLGSTINMDGTCVNLAVECLALARIYGIEMNQSSILAMVISIIMLSVGAPGVAGGALVCLAVLTTQMGIPMEGVGIIAGIYPLIGMIQTMNNCLGDVAVSMIVAKSENALDEKTYYQP